MIHFATYLLAQVTNPKPSDFDLPEVSATGGAAETLLSIVFGAVGAAAVIVIIIAGFNLATGGDDSDKIARNRKAIIYALIGLAIAVSAELIVQLVIRSIG